MQKNTHLTQEQQSLVESSLPIVHWAIRENIHVDRDIYGFEYDDLYQEGCICLCHAASTYKAGLAGFPTYAKKVVRNGLVSYCRRMYSHHKHSSRFAISGQEDFPFDSHAPKQPGSFESQADAIETLDLLKSVKDRYQGVAKLGVEALELKVKGMDVSEIASLYNVPASHVGAWISRASQKLRKDPGFLSGLI